MYIYTPENDYFFPFLPISPYMPPYNLRWTVCWLITDFYWVHCKHLVYQTMLHQDDPRRCKWWIQCSDDHIIPMIVLIHIQFVKLSQYSDWSDWFTWYQKKLLKYAPPQIKLTIKQKGMFNPLLKHYESKALSNVLQRLPCLTTMVFSDLNDFGEVFSDLNDFGDYEYYIIQRYLKNLFYNKNLEALNSWLLFYVQFRNSILQAKLSHICLQTCCFWEYMCGCRFVHIYVINLPVAGNS